ncbi:F0F1 ATP synthase subunit A [Chrysiogenes arsenatis]|uniref:F0F1 ATP synthase subunit A n=1 Tax=Chrysiogenes arsenatis TaxID=309797 RepID=UPI000409E925|nr:F0F1 ATP synthase subunit A [Chrysiogenes arsenatis]
MHPYFFLNGNGTWLTPDVIYSWIAMAIILIAGKMATSRIQEVPRGMQNFFEAIVEFIRNAVVGNMGHHGHHFVPLISAFAFYILTCNLLGLIPGFHSPTAGINTTASLAIIVFVLTHVYGVKTQGVVNYIKHFAGPVPWIAPLMMPIEIVGHLTRPVSLTLRLFGNIQGHEIVLIVIMSLVAYLVPAVIMGMGIFVSLIQTVVFCLLTMVYLTSAMEDAH